jgi:uroporphyrinogen-III decarboxylase
MTSREILLGAIRGEALDRVPVCLFIHDEGNFLKQVHPELDLAKHLECKKKLIELQAGLGLDVFVRLLHGIYPDWTVYGGVNTEAQTETWDVASEERRVGASLVNRSIVRTPGGKLEQEFTVSESVEAPGTVWYACTRKPVKTEKDLDIVMSYEPPMESDFPGRVKELVTEVKRELGDRGVLAVWVPGAAFNHASMLVELSEIYSLFLTDSAFYEKLLRFCIRRTLPYLEAIASSGADIVCMGGNVPGGFLGKKNYDRFILPFEREYVRNARRLGALSLYHNCGEIMALADSYGELGADVVEPFAPPPLGDGDLAEAKRVSGGRYTIVGNVDQVNVLKKGTMDDVRKVTRDTVEIGKKGGRFILQTADYLEYGTPMDNVRSFVETGLRFGRY